MGEEIKLLLTIAGIGLVMWIFNTVLRQAKEDTAATAVSIIGVVIILGFVGKYIVDFFQVVQTMFVF